VVWSTRFSHCLKGYNHAGEANMTTLTPEQRRAIQSAGEHPVRIEDEETRTAYVLLKEELYTRLKEAVEIEKVDPSFFEYGEFTPLPK
jgi:hypothetical protein